MAYSLEVLQEYVLVGMNQTCSDWNVDTNEVQLTLQKNTSYKENLQQSCGGLFRQFKWPLERISNKHYTH